MKQVVWTEYLRHRAQLRHFDLATVEEIVRFSPERYFDAETQRMVAVGQYSDRLVMVPYEVEGGRSRRSPFMQRRGNRSAPASDPGGSAHEQTPTPLFRRGGHLAPHRL